MIAISNKVEERTLNFRSNSLISFDSDWTISQGSGTIGTSSIVLNPNSIAELTLNNVNKKMTYIKILCKVRCNDTTISTQYNKNVAVIYKIEYTDSSIKDTTDIFYPNFTFEDNYEYYTIVELSGDKIKNINIQIINSENISINIIDIGLYYITQVNNNNINEVMGDAYESNPTDFNNMMQEYFSNNPLLIPLEQSVPAVGSRPAGYIFRLL